MGYTNAPRKRDIQCRIVAPVTGSEWPSFLRIQRCHVLRHLPVHQYTAVQVWIRISSLDIIETDKVRLGIQYNNFAFWDGYAESAHLSRDVGTTGPTCERLLKSTKFSQLFHPM